ncbi:hypothetical protein DYB34_000260 [Aphanomyces astaci]|uniref:Uncharacterized protein n=2 Tax=Aphanomyces astaci TaxID=112090 RepID=A0A418BRU1_APHAT|nr:hypothetical protein DYB34_000260 [Aphanomyces astaci]
MAENTYDALRDAIWNDDLEQLRYHMRTGRIDVNHTDSAGQTLLHLAAFWGRTDIVRVLISLGGTSVWEEKMGLLQMQVEDLTTTVVDVERQNRDHEAMVATLRADLVTLHATWAEAVDQGKAHAAERDTLAAAAADLEAAVDRLHQDVATLKQDLYESQMDGFRLDRAREQAENERDAAVQQRRDAIDRQNAALEGQAQRTRDWQAAERAAVIMETQRNMAFHERDHLELQAERLAYAQAEHRRIEEEAAEFLHAKRQQDLRLKRAARALEEFSAEKKAAAMEAAKTYGQQQTTNRRRQLAASPSREDRHRQRAQTAAALESQQQQHDLASFEAEFVHTIKTFTEARDAKWAKVKALDQQSRFDADRAARRPLVHLKDSSSAHSREDGGRRVGLVVEMY